MALSLPSCHHAAVPALAGVGAVALGVYAGAALYGTVVEQPAWRELADSNVSHKVFTTTIWKAAKLQGILAVIGGSSCIGAYALSEKKDVRLLAAGGLVLSMWPSTMAFIMPINKALTADDSHKQSSEWKGSLLAQWDSLHKVRSVGALVALGTVVWALADE
eukprot:comp18438_c1_seq1/m.19699 comp18438_c1_seq1/g.19699  ORF comp18438_c1_seq1/g.19699 comp18438_c1_seq1/m.19699 type:complete len:162 (-) comp18438_c1_seq1:18-503(-)